jgi:O-antigen ligase
VDPRFTPWPHNLYLETLADQGIVGLAALLALLGCSISLGWQLRKHAAEEVRSLSHSVLASLVAFCVSAAIELTFLRLWVVVILFVLLGTLARLSSPTSMKEDFT